MTVPFYPGRSTLFRGGAVVATCALFAAILLTADVSQAAQDRAHEQEMAQNALAAAFAASKVSVSDDLLLSGCRLVIIQRQGDACVPTFDVGFRERRIAIVLSEFQHNVQVVPSILIPGAAYLRLSPGTTLNDLIKTADAQSETVVAGGSGSIMDHERLLSEAEVAAMSARGIASNTQTVACNGETYVSLPRAYETGIPVGLLRAREIANSLQLYTEKFCR